MNDKNIIFEIKTVKSVIIKNVFEIIKPYIKEVKLLINKDGISISEMDSSKISLTHIKLNSNKFEYYICNEARSIMVDTNNLFKIIKSTNRKENITFYMNYGEEEKLGIRLIDPFVGKYKDCKLPLLEDENNENINIDMMDFCDITNIPTTQFQSIVRDANSMECKILEIKSVGNQIIFSSDDGISEFKIILSEIDSNINDEQRALLQQNGEDIRSIKFQKKSSEIVQGKFKLSYLMNFIKATQLCESMTILLDNKNPLVLEYFIADLGTMKFLLVEHYSPDN